MVVPCTAYPNAVAPGDVGLHRMNGARHELLEGEVGVAAFLFSEIPGKR